MAASGEAALAAARAVPPDVLLLDLLLPASTAPRCCRRSGRTGCWPGCGWW